LELLVPIIEKMNEKEMRPPNWWPLFFEMIY
jgi:hypothetical protein